MTSTTNAPVVFISYAHEGSTHECWVLDLATDLRRNRIDAIVDKWAFRIGDDVGRFMEASVERADYVLLICTEAYAAKANERRGGVGYEQAIVTGALLTDTTGRARMIPVLRSGTPANALPTYLRARLFVDFRSDEGYDRSLEQLLRHLHGAHEHVMPELGPPPAFASRVASEPRTDPASTPTRWVLLAGTGVQHRFTDQEREAAAAVGRALPRAGFGLITGGWPGVDETAGRAFAAEVASSNVPLENYLVQVLAKRMDPPFAAGDLVLVPDGAAEWTESVERADAVVLIGGLGGTLQTGQFAVSRGKPVFPLADTGRDARKFYLEMLADWERLGPRAIPKKTFQRVARPMPGVVADLIELLGMV